MTDGVAAWEPSAYSAAALAAAEAVPGPRRFRVDPGTDTRALRERGFHHVDTLLEAVATREQLRPLKPLDGHNMSTAAKIVDIGRGFDLDAALALCRDAVADDRLRRDLPDAAAGELRRLAAAGQVYGLFAEGALAGFIGHAGNALTLQALAPAFRGRGLAKYWWRQVIVALFNDGHQSVVSAVSAGNPAALNLYATQGFSFRRPQDIYQRAAA